MSGQRYISDSLKRKKQKIKKIKLYSIFGIGILLVVGLLYLLQLSAVQISEVNITGNMFVEKNEIEQKTQELLNKKIIGIIPLTNIFVFPKHELVESIIQNPAIASVKIRKDYFKTLSIEITEHEKKIIYCIDLEKTNCFYVNHDGFVYAQVSDLIIPEREIILFNEKEVKNITDIILDIETYTQVLLFIKNLARQEIKIKEIYLKADSTIEFVSRENTRLITSVFDEFEKDFANLIALFDQNILTKDSLQEVDYIDLRFGNKVFYKNKTN